MSTNCVLGVMGDTGDNTKKDVCQGVMGNTGNNTKKVEDIGNSIEGC